MATLDDFLPGVECIFGEIPIPVLYAQIRRAAIELCSRSLIWKERYALALVNEQSLYDLPVPAGSRPVIMHAVVSNHGRIISKTEQQLDVEYPTWREARSTFPTFFVPRLSDRQIQFSPIPANIQTGAAVSLRVSLVPTYDADTLPDFLLDQWLMAIEEGAKALLMRMPQQEWSDLNGASVAWTAFLREVDRASLSAMHDDTDGEDGRRMRDRAFENY